MNDALAGRYRRHLDLPGVGARGQARLQAARVLVVGAGGLGCAALPYLVAAGLGEVVVCDADVVEASNLPRQVLYGESDLGRPKAVAAAERLAGLNRDCTLKALALSLNAANAAALVGAADVVLDATDNFPARYLLHDACHAAGRPLVTGAVHRDEGQLAVLRFDLEPAGPCWRCLWPEPPGARQAAGGCREQGLLGPVPGVLGAMQADQVLRVVLGLPALASGELVHVDLPRAATWSTTWTTSPTCRLCSPGIAAAAVEEVAPGTDVAGEEVDWGSLRNPAACLWIDARAEREQDSDPSPAALEGLEVVRWRAYGAAGPPPGRPCVVFCGHGIRSLDLVRHWRSQGRPHVTSLRGGLAARRVR